VSKPFDPANLIRLIQSLDVGALGHG